MKYSYWYWPKYLNMDQIKNINKCKLYKTLDEKANSTKTSTVKSIKYVDAKPYLNNCVQTLYNKNKKEFKYNLFPFSNNNNLLHNTYKKGGEYNWHIDCNSDDNYDIKFTVLINVSNTVYTGGKFKIWFNEKPLTIKELNNPGAMVMFRSFHLHKVTPVLKGARKTLTLFLNGPQLQ